MKIDLQFDFNVLSIWWTKDAKWIQIGAVNDHYHLFYIGYFRKFPSPFEADVLYFKALKALYNKIKGE